MILQLFRSRAESAPKRAPSIAVCGGGTGGHLFPAVAIAEAALSRWPGARVRFLCTRRPIDASILAKTGMPFVAMPAPRWCGFSGLTGFVPESWSAFRAAAAELKAFAPDIVVGVGGYGSVPGVLAARSMGIPVVLLEQNARVGLANRFLSRFARIVCCQWKEAVGEFPRAAFTGSPIRAMKRDASAKKTLGLDPVRPTIGVLGGSQGAHALNEFFRVHADRMRGWNVIHATGAADWPRVEGAYRFHRVPSMVMPFCDRMELLYGASDLVVCRAGGTTIAEATALGVPLVLVPLPTSAAGHQEANARAAEKAGAAWLLPEPVLGEMAFDRLAHLLADRRALASMSAAGASLGNSTAREAVLSQFETVLQ